jgi:hypothetical protein
MHRELCRIVVDPHAHPALIAGQIVNPVWNRFAHLLIHEIVDCHRFRLTLGLPFTSAIAELADQFLLLCIHRNHRLATRLKSLHGRIDILELRIAIGMRLPLSGFAVALQAEAFFPEQVRHRPCTHTMSRFSQFGSQALGALARPAQR